MSHWTLLSNHGHVLLAVALDPDLRQRDIAELTAITPGAVQRILTDLEEGGFLRRERVGRRNRYHVVGGPPRHPLEHGSVLRELAAVVGSDGASPDPVGPDPPSPGPVSPGG